MLSFCRRTCQSAWSQLRLSPLFGCICPAGKNRTCDRVFKAVNGNPCIGKSWRNSRLKVSLTMDLNKKKNPESVEKSLLCFCFSTLYNSPTWKCTARNWSIPSRRRTMLKEEEAGSSHAIYSQTTTALNTTGCPNKFWKYWPNNKACWMAELVKHRLVTL